MVLELVLRGTLARCVWLSLLLGLAAFSTARAEDCRSYADKCNKAQAKAACQARDERRKVCLLFDECHEVGDGNPQVPTGSFRACFIIDEQANRSGSEDFKYDEGDISDPEDNRGPPRCKKACFGDPIDATTGNKFETHTEFVSGGPFPLRIEWTYNANGTSAALLPKDLMFGRNRSHFYGRRVTSTTAGNLTQTLVARPDGKTLRFYKAEDAGWASDGDDPGRLSLEALPGGASLYRFDDGKGGVEFYDMNGQLLRLRDADGEEQTLAYAAGMLDRVVDRYGRALTFEYDGGHLVRLHQPDGQVITFAYSSNGDLIDVRYPDGGRTEYRYDEPGLSAASANSGLMTAVIHDGQRYSSTKYDSYGRATSTWLGSGVDRYDFSYSGSGAVPSYFTVTLPSGGTRYGPVRLKQGAAMPDYVYSSRPCSGCEYQWTTYKYDANSYVDTANVGGSITDFDYNSRGLLTQKTESSNQAATKRTEQTTWHASYPVPLERRMLSSSGAVVSRTTWTYNDRGQESSRTEHDPATGLARTTSTTYCEQADVDTAICPLLGLLLAMDGPHADVADVTNYQYYAADHPSCETAPTTCAWRKGDLWKVTNGLGQVIETLAYDGAGRVLSTKDSNGVITDLDYDPRGRLKSRTTRASN